MLTGGAGVEHLPECYDTVTGNDIVDKLILKERDDTHTLKNWKKKDTRKNTL